MEQRWPWPARIRWLTGLAVAAVVAVNMAGIWSIAMARRGAQEQAAGYLRLETESRARAVESVLASTRADLAFLTGSEAFFTLETALSSSDPRESRWRRLGAEAALLLFLRGHPEVAHLSVRSHGGVPLLAAGRRGGVPVLWRPTGADRSETADGRRLTTSFAFEAPPGAASPEAVAIQADVDAAGLLQHGRPAGDTGRACRLADALGRAIASEPGRGGAVDPGTAGDHGDSGAFDARASLRAEGWSVASPWTLICRQTGGPAVALLEPLAARYRVTLGLNLAVMSLALLLGWFAIQQARRAGMLEAGAREEARVRELERQLFHTERLGTVGRLAAGMAHEINNPLEGMSNYLSLAAESLARGDGAAAQRHVARVREGLDRAAAVVRQVLAHADPARAPRTPLDLNAAISQAAEFVRSRKEFSGLRFDLDLAEAGAQVEGSPVMLGQVFLNLLLNACEAQPSGGEVAVRTWTQDGTVHAEIADRGPGVAPEDAARIFEPFFSTKQSTGLGLSICHAIVLEHGGELTVTSRPGGGAVFRLSFPASSGAGR